jgi:hypothetical protein
LRPSANRTFPPRPSGRFSSKLDVYENFSRVFTFYNVSVASSLGRDTANFRARSTEFQKNTHSKDSRRTVPVNRSTNRCDVGSYGTDVTSSISLTRRFAPHR